jgi:hypothetical protein
VQELRRFDPVDSVVDSRQNSLALFVCDSRIEVLISTSRSDENNLSDIRDASDPAAATSAGRAPATPRLFVLARGGLPFDHNACHQLSIASMR